MCATKGTGGRKLDDTNLRAILEGTSDGIFAVETSGRFAYVNASAADLIGITPTSVPPELWAETFGLFLPDEITLMPQAQLPFALAMKGESIHDLAMFVRNDHVASGLSTCAPRFGLGATAAASWSAASSLCATARRT